VKAVSATSSRGYGQHMRLFRRRPREPPPEWAVALLDAEGWEAFRALVEHAVVPRGWTPDFGEGVVRGGPDGGTCGLGNLAAMCHAAPREEWQPLVERHFELLVAAMEPTPFSGPDEARAAVKARLVDDAFVNQLPWQLAERRVADDLRLVLAYDLPTTVRFPPREDVLEWGDEAELFELGIEHARAEPGLGLERHELPAEEGPGSSLSILVGDSFFTCTHALWADTLDPPPSEHGTLVAAPTRHIVVAYPIRDLQVVGALRFLVPFVQRRHAEGPGPITDSLYWLRDDALERLDVTLNSAGAVQFTPPDAFVEMLNRLD
jgi:hypothetical protein